MWKRFSNTVRCVECGGLLDLQEVEAGMVAVGAEARKRGEAMGLTPEALGERVETGVLVCTGCKLWFPILHGLPVLLPYRTATHSEFEERHRSLIRNLGHGYSPPDKQPVRGEEFVLESFSEEWMDYSYDGVLWTWTYEDREALFKAEMGGDGTAPVPSRFLEIGCGLGLVTSFAAKEFSGDAVGVDLSLAAMRAAMQFSENPFLHFVQASLWKLPFEKGSFGRVYSHGVLHHTHSTEKAFRTAASFCGDGGQLYVWLYGLGSIHESMVRRAAYGAECVLRPVLARMPGTVATAALAPISVAYMGVNRIQRLLGSRREAYTYQRALHAARDRFTPLFAFRTREEDLARWFCEEGFSKLHVLEPEETPAATRETIRRNLGMWGRRNGHSPERSSPDGKE